ncbi:hypothetical protein, partial [Escherichia coli]
NWNGEAARYGAILYARRKDGAGRPLCDTPEEISRRTYDALIRRSSEVVLETVFAEDGLDGPDMVASPLTQRALSGQGGIA